MHSSFDDDWRPAWHLRMEMGLYQHGDEVRSVIATWLESAAEALLPLIDRLDCERTPVIEMSTRGRTAKFVDLSLEALRDELAGFRQDRWDLFHFGATGSGSKDEVRSRYMAARPMLPHEAYLPADQIDAAVSLSILSKHEIDVWSQRFLDWIRVTAGPAAAQGALITLERSSFPETYFGSGKFDLRHSIPAVTWATLLNPQHIAVLGGVDQVVTECPVSATVLAPASDGPRILLRLSPSILELSDDTVAACREYLRPVMSNVHR